MVDDDECATQESLFPTFTVYAELLTFLSSSSQSKKKGHKQAFQRTNMVWGILVSQDELNKQRSYRFKGAAKNLWRHVWTGAMVNSLGS